MIEPRVLRRWLAPLQGSALHPQWLVLRSTRKLIRRRAASLGGIVVDIGCADGWLRHCLAPDARYIGLDYPPAVAAGYGSKPEVFGDGESLPFADASVDVVALLEVLEHLPDPGRCMAEAARILKPGGTLLLSVPFLYPLHDEPRDFQRWTRFGLQRLLETSGFEVEEQDYRGNPMETAALMGCIALASGLLAALRRRGAAILLVPLLGLLIPVVNLLGWGLSALLPASDLMPMGYQLIGHRHG